MRQVFSTGCNSVTLRKLLIIYKMSNLHLCDNLTDVKEGAHHILFSLYNGKVFPERYKFRNSFSDKWRKRQSITADVPIFSLKLSPENICIAGLRHRHKTVSSCLGPQSLQEQIINLKPSIQFLNNLGILINHLFFFLSFNVLCLHFGELC